MSTRNFLYLSDLHLEFDRTSLDLQPLDAAGNVLLIAGDLDRKLHGVNYLIDTFQHSQVVYVFGNHEYYGTSIEKLHRRARRRLLESGKTNIHLLNNESVVFDGVRIFGSTYWTDVATNPAIVRDEMNDYTSIRIGPQYRRLSIGAVRKLHADAIRALRETCQQSVEPVVVVTHHAPTSGTITETDDCLSAYASADEDLMLDLQPVAWIHGHFHESVETRIGITQVLSNPRGYPIDSDRNPEFKLRRELCIPRAALQKTHCKPQKRASR